MDENEIFEAYRAAEGEERERLARLLIEALTVHAKRVCWMKLQQDAPDVVQRSVAAAFQHMEKFRGDSKFSTWFHKIVLNYCKMALRWRQAHPEALLEDARTQETPSPEDAVLSKVFLEQLMQKLSPQERDFLQRQLETLDPLRLPEIPGLRQGTVRQRWRRLRRKLQQLQK